jgi:flagellar hook-associated protein 2
MDWRSVVDQLMQLDRVPQDRLRTQQTSITQQSTALDRIKGKLATLQGSLADLAFSSSSASTRSTSVLNSIYQEYDIVDNASGSSTGFAWAGSGKGALPKSGTSRVNQSPAATIAATASAPLGTYTVEVTQLGSQYSVISNSMADTSSDTVMNLVLNKLPLGAAITDGVVKLGNAQFEVGIGKEIDPTVTKVYELVEIITQNTIGTTAEGKYVQGQIEISAPGWFSLGSTATDSSNLMKLLGLSVSSVSENGVPTYLSPVALGNFSLNTKIEELKNTLVSTNQALLSSGSFEVNGVLFNWNESDTVASVISSINASDAGVTASYNRVDGKVMLVAKGSGSPISLSNDTGGLLTNLGLLDQDGFPVNSTGSEFLYSVSRDGVPVGKSFRSMSGTLDLTEAGLEGISVQVTETGKTTFSISADSSAALAKVKSFVDAYNAVRQDIEDSTKITSADGKVTTSVLSGNRDLMGVASSLRKFIFTPMTGPTLAATTTKDLFELTVTGAGLSALKVGAEISGAGIPSGAKVTAIDTSSNKVTISSAATASAAGVSLKSSSTARYTQMEQLGLAFRGTSGDLYIKDSGKLQTALASYSSDVEKFFTSAGVAATSTGTTTFDSVYPTQGVAERLDNYLNKIIGYNGLFEIQKKSLTSRSKTIDKQIADMERLLKQRQAALERSFIQMEQAQQQVQTQLSALTGSLSGFSSNSSKK